MKSEVTVRAATVDEAVAKGAAELGVSANEIEYEVLEEPKKGFLGIGASPATVKVTHVFKPLDAAAKFVNTIIADLELNATATIEETGNGEATVTVSGDDASALIGHHGDTLDAFQYLVNLAANKKESDERKYTRITVDIENYREKREKTLRALANRMAEKVKKNGRSISLEPMNAYERRIIHSEVQLIPGVTTNSVGQEGDRRVVIYLEGSAKPTEAKAPRASSGKGGDRRRNGKKNDRRSSSSKATRTDSAEKPTYKRPDTPRPQPRKIEKAKDLDSYFAKLREFGSSIQ
ncbi:MAG: RNA-binding cell elongation regulator Jag/EloR [Eubacteriales bacterium]